MSYDRDENEPAYTPRPPPTFAWRQSHSGEYDALRYGLILYVVPLTGGWRYTIYPPDKTHVARGQLRGCGSETALEIVDHIACVLGTNG